MYQENVSLPTQISFIKVIIIIIILKYPRLFLFRTNGARHGQAQAAGAGLSLLLLLLLLFCLLFICDQVLICDFTMDLKLEQTANIKLCVKLWHRQQWNSKPGGVFGILAPRGTGHHSGGGEVRANLHGDNRRKWNWTNHTWVSSGHHLLGSCRHHHGSVGTVRAIFVDRCRSGYVQRSRPKLVENVV